MQSSPVTAAALLVLLALPACRDADPADEWMGEITPVASPAGPGSRYPHLAGNGNGRVLSWLQALTQGGFALQYSRWRDGAWGHAFGAGGSFSEFYAMDFNDDVLLMGHDGPGHLAIAEGKPTLEPLGVFHGKPGKGLSIEMKVKNGPVTILAVVQTKEGKMKLLAAEGESVPGPILEIGNTNSRYKFSVGMKGFIDLWSKQGPAHHCAIGVGHIAGKLRKLAVILGLEFVQVC